MSVCFEVHGQGRPVVLVHAISAGQRMWHPQVAALSDRARLITFDARGVGRSPDLVGWRGLRARMADDIAMILDELGEPSAIICGVSFGGVLAQEFAARHCHRVEGLIIVDSYGDTRPRSPSKALWLASVYAGSVANFLPRTVMKTIMRRTYARWPQAAAYFVNAMDELRPWQAFKTRNAINLVNYHPMLAAGNYPITVVVGENSWWRSDRYAAELVAAVPRANLIRVPDSADPTPLCQPEAFTEIVAECLRWPRTPGP